MGKIIDLNCMICICRLFQTKLLKKKLFKYNKAYLQEELSIDYEKNNNKVTPPDLPSILLSKNIIYIGMPLFSKVTELVISQLLYLQYCNRNKPIYLYINSTGNTRVDENSSEIFYESSSICDTICCTKNEIGTVAVGLAYGSACLLLAAGAKGRRKMLAHSTAMIYQPRLSIPGKGQRNEIESKWKEVSSQRNIFLQILKETTDLREEKIWFDIHVPYIYNLKMRYTMGS